jgi:hypothetical protein
MMTNSGKPTIFITNLFGWTTRNFFQTGVVEELTRTFNVVVLASPQMKEGLARLGLDKNVTVVEHSPGSEPWLWRMFRQAKKKLYTHSRKSVTEATWAKYKARPAYQRVGSIVFEAITAIVPAIRLYDALEWIDYKINRSESMREVFERYRPQFVFFTHLTHFGDEVIFRNAMRFGVPRVYMILSWDHVSTAKVLLSRHIDHMLVWNEHSRQEVKTTYPKLTDRSISVVGVPQYDFYKDKPRYTYAEWCAKYNLDPRKRTILFSTMAQSRHDQQHIILDRLLTWLQLPEQADLMAQVLIKTHPFDNFPGYDPLMEKGYPVGMHQTSLPPGVKQQEWIPDAAEIEAGRDALYYCSVNINLFSTVTIEASYFDKPIIHIAFDPEPVVNRIPCKECYKWDHFSHVVDKKATTLVESDDELFAAIRHALKNPADKAKQRAEVVSAYIGQPVGSARAAIVEDLTRYSNLLRTQPKATISAR